MYNSRSSTMVVLLPQDSAPVRYYFSQNTTLFCYRTVTLINFRQLLSASVSDSLLADCPAHFLVL